MDETTGIEETGNPGGIVEKAIRQMSDRRSVVMWEGTPVEPGPELAEARDSGTLHSEKLRALRTELVIRLGKRNGAAVVAMLGARPGEGRSQLCAELALAFGQLAGRTLLIDANMRNPRLHKLFSGASTEVGLSDLLLGKTSTVPLHRVIGPQGLALLTAGTPPDSPVDLLSGTAFKKLMADWSRSYNYILIDTPPVARYSDGIVIANAVGNVLLVTRRHQTTYEEVTEVQRRLDATQTQIIGAVINEF